MISLLLLMQVAASQPMNLTCFGRGTANKLAVANVFGSNNVYGNIGGRSFSAYGDNSATVTGTRQQGFEDQVDIRLFAGDDRIRLPRTLLPPLHGGNDGWFKLKNVKVDARSIHGSVAVNVINNPKVFIDRVTGSISISGKAGDYAGMCEAFRGDAPPKF